MLIPQVLMFPIRLPWPRIEIFWLTSTSPRTLPKITTSRALILARTFPFGPTVSRLSDSKRPSTSPSTSNSSRERISPFMYMDAPIAAEAAGAAALAGAGLRRVVGWDGVSRLGSGNASPNSSFCLFHTRPFSLVAFMSARTKVWNATRCTLRANRFSLMICAPAAVARVSFTLPPAAQWLKMPNTKRARKKLASHGKPLMSDLHELHEGTPVGSAYTLEHHIRHTGAGAFFSVVTNTGERRLMKLIPERSATAEQQFATWQRSRHLRHENLIHLGDVGRAALEGTDCIYAVFEYPDDALSSALQHGPLSDPEARGVLEAALAALRYLHGQGMVHGALDAGHVVAVGDAVKLSTDGLAESDDLEGPLEDVRQLGELLRAMRTPEPLSEPFASFVEHATAAELRQRWTLAELAKLIEPPPAAPPVAATPIEVAATPPTPTTPTLGPAPILPSAPVPATATPHSPGSPKWVLAGMAILLVSIVAFGLHHRPDAPQVSAAAPAVVRPDPKPVPPRVAAPPAPARVPAVPSGKWRVIAFTYHSPALAQKKAHQINKHWPDLHAALFAPKASRGYYLVALGHGMDREKAIRLQRTARGRGLPRDTYVQNYAE